MVKLFLKVMGLGWLGIILLLVASAVLINNHDKED